jgi:hypothetical protein
MTNIQTTHAARPVELNHGLRITACWTAADGTSGRETLCIRTPIHWRNELTSADLRLSRDLGLFAWEHAGQLEYRYEATAQEEARDRISAAARALTFMAATGLRPASNRQAEQCLRMLHDLPRRDHQTVWRDPASAEILLVDEPYQHAESLLQQRVAWSERHGTHVAATTVAGIYAPRRCPLFLCGSSTTKPRIEEIIRQIEAVPSWAWDESAWTSGCLSTRPQSPVRCSKSPPTQSPKSVSA